MEKQELEQSIFNRVALSYWFQNTCERYKLRGVFRNVRILTQMSMKKKPHWGLNPNASLEVHMMCLIRAGLANTRPARKLISIIHFYPIHNKMNIEFNCPLVIVDKRTPNEHGTL